MNARNARNAKSLQAISGIPQILTWHLSFVAPACRAAGRDYRLPCFAWGYAGEPVRQPVSARRSGRHRFHRSHRTYRTYRTYQPDPVPATTRPLTAPVPAIPMCIGTTGYRLPATGHSFPNVGQVRGFLLTGLGQFL